MRRQPIYFLVNNSIQSHDYIESYTTAIDTIIDNMRHDPYLLETAYISIYTFSDKINCIYPLESIIEVDMSKVVGQKISDGAGDFVSIKTLPLKHRTYQMPFGNSDYNNIGNVLISLTEIIGDEVVKTTPEKKGDWRPVLIIFTDSIPSDMDTFNKAINVVHKAWFLNVVIIYDSHYHSNYSKLTNIAFNVKSSCEPEFIKQVDIYKLRNTYSYFSKI